jgi:predicted dehydrogenase
MKTPDLTGIPHIGVGILGHAFMGKAHSNGYKQMPYIFYPPPAVPRLVSMCGRNEAAVREAAMRYGWEEYTTDWHDLVGDPRIQVFDNSAANYQHDETSIAAAQAGKHILCEKPMAISAPRARAMRDAVKQAGVKHMVNFNYRMVPAVRQAKMLIENGEIGEIYHFRGRYIQEAMVDPKLPWTWRSVPEQTGYGVLSDLGSHIIDLMRFLGGEPKNLSAMMTTFIKKRPLPDGSGKTAPHLTDDAFQVIAELESGALANIEGSKFCHGRKNMNTFEVNGTRGSLWFNLEQMNELWFYRADTTPREANGFRNVLVTDKYHPFIENWWPEGHIIGWENTFVHSVYLFMKAVARDEALDPLVATFEDGYRNAVITDAIAEAARTGARVPVTYA